MEKLKSEYFKLVGLTDRSGWSKDPTGGQAIPQGISDERAQFVDWMTRRFSIRSLFFQGPNVSSALRNCTENPRLVEEIYGTEQTPDPFGPGGVESTSLPFKLSRKLVGEFAEEVWDKAFKKHS